MEFGDPPFETKPIGCKWVFKNKYKSDVSLDKHKARLMVKGFAQKEVIDYEENLSPTTKWATIHTLFSLATQNGCEGCLLQCILKIECLHVLARGFYCEGTRT
jgi:hypothetical protein